MHVTPILIGIFTSLAITVSTDAQTRTFTSPRGFDTTEASSHHSYVLASVDKLRFQQVDSSVRGLAGSLTSIAWRRDGSMADNSAFGSRTLENVSIRLSHSLLNRISTSFDSNYIGAATTVFGPKNVNAPDWTRAPTSAPAPFDFKIVFDRPFAYDGVRDLLWEVRVDKVSSAPTALRNYPFDFAPLSGSLSTVSHGSTIGGGCRTPNGRFVLAASAYNHGGSFRIRHVANFGPSRSAIVTFLDVADPNQSIPGLCATLRANPLVLLPLGASSSTGFAEAAFAAGLPHSNALVGANLFLQAVSLDASQPGIQIALSSAIRVTLPVNPTLPGAGYVHSYTTGGGTFTRGPWVGGIIARFESR